MSLVERNYYGYDIYTPDEGKSYHAFHTHFVGIKFSSFTGKEEFDSIADIKRAIHAQYTLANSRGL